MKRSQAATNASGVLRRPKPYTVMADSRKLVARRVKSLSLETSTKPSTLPAYRRSIASMISAESVEFLPRVYANCCTGWIACRCSSCFQPASCCVVQSPYARLIDGVPYLAISASSSAVRRVRRDRRAVPSNIRRRAAVLHDLRAGRRDRWAAVARRRGEPLARLGWRAWWRFATAKDSTRIRSRSTSTPAT